MVYHLRECCRNKVRNVTSNNYLNEVLLFEWNCREDLMRLIYFNQFLGYETIKWKQFLINVQDSPIVCEEMVTMNLWNEGDWRNQLITELYVINGLNFVCPHYFMWKCISIGPYRVTMLHCRHLHLGCRKPLLDSTHAFHKAE